LLVRALESVLSQTHAAAEIIVIDDGSTDHTVDLISGNYPSIKLMTQDNRGVSAARNTGIRTARGEWIALLDSDDEWFPEKLQRQMQALQDNPGYRVVHCNEIWIRNGRRVNPMKKHRKHGGRIFKHCLPLCTLSPSAVVLHREVFEEVGLFDEALPVCEDYEMWLRICAKHPVLLLEEALVVKYGGHSDQLSRRYWGMDRFRIIALDKVISSGALNDIQRQAAVAMLQHKIFIYLKGARKHKNTMMVPEFEQLARRYSTP
jgi:glycosyltransferase involved in cell wall biosynthesis